MAVSELAGLAPNTPYHYRISATNAAGTAKGADRSVKTLPIVEPTVNTEPATAVEPTSAVLNGTVNPNGSEVTECLFEYGTTPSYGTIASCYENPGSGNSPVTVKAPISGLKAGTSHHLRTRAKNVIGTGTGGDLQFKTQPPKAPTGELSQAGFDRGSVKAGPAHSDIPTVIRADYPLTPWRSGVGRHYLLHQPAPGAHLDELAGLREALGELFDCQRMAHLILDPVPRSLHRNLTKRAYRGRPTQGDYGPTASSLDAARRADRDGRCTEIPVPPQGAGQARPRSRRRDEWLTSC